MWKKGFCVAIVSVILHAANAQPDHLISFSDNHDFDQIRLSLTATDGSYFIIPGTDTEFLKINPGVGSPGIPTFEEQIIERTKQINVKLNKENKAYLGSSLSRRMFSGTEDGQTWKVYLSGKKPMALDLIHAVGDTHIDLSGLPVHNLKMHSGSANVFVSYEPGQGNLVEMDTFKIKVDMGKFNAKNLFLSRSRNVIADVGFGSVYMDFENAMDIASDIKATVGAGKLEVILPQKHIPIRININDSPLCRIKMPAGFQKSQTSVYSNTEVALASSLYLNFDIDVAVGNIVFKYADK